MLLVTKVWLGLLPTSKAINFYCTHLFSFTCVMAKDGSDHMSEFDKGLQNSSIGQRPLCSPPSVSSLRHLDQMRRIHRSNVPGHQAIACAQLPPPLLPETRFTYPGSQAWDIPLWCCAIHDGCQVSTKKPLSFSSLLQISIAASSLLISPRSTSRSPSTISSCSSRTRTPALDPQLLGESQTYMS